MEVSLAIPFCGFYESWHDNAIDDAIIMDTTDDQGEVMSPLLSERIWNEIDWPKVWEPYARLYTESFGEEVGIPLRFEELLSPRQYNFETNRIFAVADSNLIRPNPKTLQRTAKELFTSRPGFCSFYEPDPATWGARQEWDCNEWYCALLAHLEDQGMCRAAIHDWERDFAGEINCNGDVSIWVHKAATKEGGRLFNIASYLREREERQWRN